MLVEVAVPRFRSSSLPMVAALLSSAAFTLASCAKPVPQAPPPPSVSVVTVHAERIAETEEFAGEISPVRRVEVRSPVAGIIVGEPIDEGAQVTPGEVLFKIDRTIYDAAWRGAKARLVQAQARFDNATRTLARLKPLLAEHAVAQRDVDDAEAGEAQARAAVDDAKASVDRAAKDLGDTDIKAEIAGRVAKANLMLGARVTGPAELLTTIDVVDPVRVTFRPSTQQVLSWNIPRPEYSITYRRCSIRRLARRSTAPRCRITATCWCRDSSCASASKGWCATVRSWCRNAPWCNHLAASRSMC